MRYFVHPELHRSDAISQAVLSGPHTTHNTPHIASVCTLPTCSQHADTMLTCLLSALL